MIVLIRRTGKTNLQLCDIFQKTKTHICCYSQGKVRVRFAPSPTGFLHLGGLRTALYNHLFAKSHNGVSLIRIEDTDQERLVENATENLIRDLAWCGIKYDEPTVFQSQRLHIYKKLDLLRRESVKAGEVPKYDNKCRTLSRSEVESRLEAGQPSCIRFKLSSFKESINDIVYGNFEYDAAAYEGDPVIMKTDGFPTYHLANVVDDHLMEITHVLRGVEWQISTTKHLLLYRAFGWTPPSFGHLPLLLNPDGTKISKRMGQTQVRYFRESGYMPKAVLNFVTAFGGGFCLEPSEKDSRVFSLEELAQKFDITKVKTSSCKVFYDKLEMFNKLEIDKLFETEEGKATLVEAVKQVIRSHFRNSEESSSLKLQDEYIISILNNIKHRLWKLQDLVSNDLVFLWSWKNTWREEDSNIRKLMETLAGKIVECQSEWSKDYIKELVGEVTRNNKPNKVSFMKSLRRLLIEQEVGPSIVEIMSALGKDNVHVRLVTALNKSKNQE